jgi:hypothetical protein
LGCVNSAVSRRSLGAILYWGFLHCVVAVDVAV